MKILLSNADKTPIYEQLEVQIRNQILEGKLEADEMLPSIRGLAKDLGISVITVKKAYENLEQEGYIHTVGGKGSFVAGQSIERLKEKKMQLLEEELSKIINEIKVVGLSKNQLETIINVLWEEGK